MIQIPLEIFLANSGFSVNALRLKWTIGLDKHGFTLSNQPSWMNLSRIRNHWITATLAVKAEGSGYIVVH